MTMNWRCEEQQAVRGLRTRVHLVAGEVDQQWGRLADQAGRPDWLPRLHAIHAELMQLYSQVCAEANEQEAEHHAAITTNTR